MPRGRPKGAVNKVTRDVREAAREYSDEALEALATIMRTGTMEQARVAAAKELLDRAHGKSTARLEVDASASDALTEALDLARKRLNGHGHSARS